MQSLSSVSGARAPLLDRLVDERGSSPVEERSRRVLRGPDLLVSVEAELFRLLNTRRSLPDTAPEALRSTVLGYGIRDFTGRYSRDPAVLRYLTSEITEAIGRFEPRLREVEVTVEPMPGSGSELIVRIDGVLRSGHVDEPVGFRIPLQAGEARAR